MEANANPSFNLFPRMAEVRKKTRTPYAHGRDEFETVSITVNGKVKKGSRCKHCPGGNVLSSQNSTNLNEHLASHHPEIWKVVEGKRAVVSILRECLVVTFDIPAKDEAAREAKRASIRPELGKPVMSALYQAPPPETDESGMKRKAQVFCLNLNRLCVMK